MRKLGTLIDVNTGNKISEYHKLIVRDIYNHTVGIINVDNATLEVKYGLNRQVTPLPINGFSIIEKRTTTTVVARIDLTEYTVDSSKRDI